MRKAIGAIIAVGVGSSILLVATLASGWMPVTVRIPIVRPHGKGDPKMAALFSHWSHDQYSCYVCHPTIFPQALLGFTHDELDDGRYCASCHNAKVAPSVDDMECKSCHRD